MKVLVRKFLLLLAVVLPQPVKRALYRRVFGWQIGRRVRLGLSYLDARRVTVGDGARIGHFNVFRGLERLEIGPDTYIANLNQFFGAGAALGAGGSELVIGAGVNFMSRHFVDVAGRVEIGARSTIGGRDTQIWSHTLRVREGRQALEAAHVRVGEGAYIGARAVLVCCDIPAGAMVGAGSVVAKRFPAEPCRLLIAGNPATVVKRYAESSDPGPPDAAAPNVRPLPQESGRV